MTQSLDHPGAKDVTAVRTRSIELAQTPEQALELLRGPGNPPTYTEAQAKRVTGRKPFVVVRDGGFAIYKPWRRREIAPEGVSAEGIEVGPAVVGRFVETPNGSRLEVRVTPWAPAPAQRLRTITVAAVGTLLLLGMVAISGGHPIALGLAALMGGGSLWSILFYDRRQRRQDIHELLAIVERTFGPLELPSGDAAPHRRDENPALPDSSA